MMTSRASTSDELKTSESLLRRVLYMITYAVERLSDNTLSLPPEGGIVELTNDRKQEIKRFLVSDNYPTVVRNNIFGAQLNHKNSAGELQAAQIWIKSIDVIRIIHKVPAMPANSARKQSFARAAQFEKILEGKLPESLKKHTKYYLSYLLKEAIGKKAYERIADNSLFNVEEETYQNIVKLNYWSKLKAKEFGRIVGNILPLWNGTEIKETAMQILKEDRQIQKIDLPK